MGMLKANEPKVEDARRAIQGSVLADVVDNGNGAKVIHQSAHALRSTQRMTDLNDDMQCTLQQICESREQCQLRGSTSDKPFFGSRTAE
jgi:hypothetical protein